LPARRQVDAFTESHRNHADDLSWIGASHRSNATELAAGPFIEGCRTAEKKKTLRQATHRKLGPSAPRPISAGFDAERETETADRVERPDDASSP